MDLEETLASERGAAAGLFRSHFGSSRDPSPQLEFEELAMLVAEQTAKNAKAVNQGIPVVHTQTTGSTAQQTILSVFESVLSMQIIGCHSVSEQLMAAGATDEDVKKISQIMAHTVRQLEAGNTPPEPGLEAHRLPCQVMVSDEEFSTGECIPGFSKMDIEGQETIKRSLSNAYAERKRLAKKCKIRSATPSLVLDSTHRRAILSRAFQSG